MFPLQVLFARQVLLSGPVRLYPWLQVNLKTDRKVFSLLLIIPFRSGLSFGHVTTAEKKHKIVSFNKQPRSKTHGIVKNSISRDKLFSNVKFMQTVKYMYTFSFQPSGYKVDTKFKKHRQHTQDVLSQTSSTLVGLLVQLRVNWQVCD